MKTSGLARISGFPTAENRFKNSRSMPNPLFRRRTYLPLYLELIAHLIVRCLYRVRTSGLESLPRTGGVLLITNHITYVDVVVLQLACPRPIRFIGHKGLRRNRFFNWSFDVTGS